MKAIEKRIYFFIEKTDNKDLDSSGRNFVQMQGIRDQSAGWTF